MSALVTLFFAGRSPITRKALYYFDAQSRLRRIKETDVDELHLLHDALKYEDLQKTVRSAIELRIRKLEKLEASA